MVWPSHARAESGRRLGRAAAEALLLGGEDGPSTVRVRAEPVARRKHWRALAPALEGKRRGLEFRLTDTGNRS